MPCAVACGIFISVWAKMKRALWDSPVLGTNYQRLARRVAYERGQRTFEGSAKYWDSRYSDGGTSGPGSAGRLAQFKADILNQFIDEASVHTAIEFGSGDGSQLAKIAYPSYIGLDVSPRALAICKEAYSQDPTKQFILYPAEDVTPGRKPFVADVALSIDVIYHLIEDEVYELYMADLFSAASKWVVLYTTDSDIFRDHPDHPHVRHRPVRRDIARRFPDWRLERVIANRYPPRTGDPDCSLCDFLFYRYQPA